MVTDCLGRLRGRCAGRFGATSGLFVGHWELLEWLGMVAKQFEIEKTGVPHHPPPFFSTLFRDIDFGMIFD